MGVPSGQLVPDRVADSCWDGWMNELHPRTSANLCSSDAIWEALGSLVGHITLVTKVLAAGPPSVVASGLWARERKHITRTARRVHAG